MTVYVWVSEYRVTIMSVTSDTTPCKEDSYIRDWVYFCAIFMLCVKFLRGFPYQYIYTRTHTSNNLSSLQHFFFTEALSTNINMKKKFKNFLDDFRGERFLVSENDYCSCLKKNYVHCSFPLKIFLFFSHEKRTMTLSFLNSWRHILPLEDFCYIDGKTMTLPINTLGNSQSPLSIFQRWMYSSHKFIWLTLSW